MEVYTGGTYFMIRLIELTILSVEIVFVTLMVSLMLILGALIAIKINNVIKSIGNFIRRKKEKYKTDFYEMDQPKKSVDKENT